MPETMIDATDKYQYLIDLVGEPKGGVKIWLGNFGTPNTMKLSDFITMEKTEKRMGIVLNQQQKADRERFRVSGAKWHIFIDEAFVVGMGEGYNMSPQGTIDIVLIHELSHTHATAEAPGIEFDEFAPGLVTAQIRGILNYLVYKPSAATDLLGYIAERFDAEVEGWPIPPRFRKFLGKLNKELR